MTADGRVFAALAPADREAVLRRAACLPRRALLDAVLSAPAENRALADDLAPRLAAALPGGFDRSALDRLLSEGARRGVPFVDPDPALDDAALRWTGGRIVVAPPR